MSNLELTYQSFVNRISAVTKKDILFRLTRRILIALTSFAVIAFILVSLEAIFGFSSIARKFLFYGFISSFAATFLSILAYSFISYIEGSKPVKINYYAKRIGDNFPEIKDNLLNAIQIYGDTKRVNYAFSNDLAAESINHVNETSQPFNFLDIVSFKRINSSAILFASAFLFFTALFLVFPNVFQAAAYRLIDYNYTFVENTLGIAYDVKPGSIEISKGESLDISAKIMFNDKNYKTEQVTFNTKTVTNEGIELTSNSEKLNASDVNEFKTRLNNINAGTIYWFEYKGVHSNEYKISLTNRPLIKSSKITVYPPAYTKLPSRVIDGTEISTIAGSRIYVEIEGSDDVTKSYVLFSDGTPFRLGVSGKNALGSFTASKNETFKLSITKDFNGKELTNPNSQEYQLRVYPDEYPKISVIEPGSEMSVQGQKEVTIRSRITDDFGFTKMRLAYKLSKSKYGMTDKDYKYVDIPLKNTDATGVEVPYVWQLSGLNLGTEDEVEYFVEVYDNDGINGPKMSKSEVRKLVYPSLESLLNKTEKSKDEIENSMKSAFEDAKELKQQLDEIKEKMEKNPEELGLNDPKKQQELQNKIENIQNQFSNTEKKLEELMKDLQNNNQISKETLQKYMELQKMFQQIDSKELRDALKKLQEAMKNMNKDQLQEAMKNFKFDEENFKKSLEKTMDLLKKVMNEQKFGELTQKLDEMAKKQNELKNETEKTNEQDKNKMNDLSKSQDELQKQYEEFQQKMKELNENMKQLKNDKSSEKMSKEMEKMLEEMMKKQTEQKMKDASQDLQNSNKQQSQKNENNASQDLNEMNQKMQDMLSQMIDQENSKLDAKMQEFLDKLKEMSKKQQELKDQSKELDKNSQQSEYQKNQQQQESLKSQLSKTIEEMMAMAQQMGMTPQMSKNLGDAYNEMDKAAQKLGSKDGKNANIAQGNAKDALDKAAEKMSQMCQNGKQGKNGQKPGSGMEQLLQALQNMIQQQQGLNQKMGQTDNKGQLTQEQMAQMQKLSMDQQTIQKNMQKLNEDFKKKEDLEGTKMLGNLDEIQKQMMETIKDLQNNNITPETRQRQEKILSRMLDFQLATREKDFEQKRESRPGKDFDRSSPPEIVISKPNVINGVNQDALELQKDNYSEDYETLIQKYMEKMKSVSR